MNPATDVEYRTLPEFEGYRFGSNGTVQSCWSQSGQTTVRFRTLKADTMKGGYLRVRLRVSPGKYVKRQVHHLILEAFVGVRPLNTVGCHWDGDPKNNSVENLRWDTRHNNEEDKKRHGTHQTGENNPAAKLTAPEVVAIRKMRSLGYAYSAISEVFPISPNYAKNVALGKVWKHV